MVVAGGDASGKPAGDQILKIGSRWSPAPHRPSVRPRDGSSASSPDELIAMTAHARVMVAVISAVGLTSAPARTSVVRGTWSRAVPLAGVLSVRRSNRLRDALAHPVTPAKPAFEPSFVVRGHRMRLLLFFGPGKHNRVRVAPMQPLRPARKDRACFRGIVA